MSARLSHSAKVFIALICLASWLQASNHCVLLSLGQSLKKHACCQAHSTSTKGESQMVCCQLLQTVEQTTVVAPAAPTNFSLAQPLLLPEFLLPVIGEEYLASIRIGDPPAPGVPIVLDLQRCHPAIAPPVV